MNRRAPGIDLRSIARDAMRDHGLEPEFGPAAEAEIRAIPGPATASGPGFRDLRGLLWASIDNDDSLDLDQLSVGEALAGGRTRILVAVADVNALVGKGSPIDDHAKTNTTSVYTAAQIFPMLPERLSTDLTSLRQDVDRLAYVVDMVVADGAVAGSEVYRAVVRNKAKLAYDSVAAWLDGDGPRPAPLAAVDGMEAQLRLQDGIAQALRARRRDAGALGLETDEPRPVFAGDELVDMRPEPRNRAKDLIEEFMVAANQVTARFLDARGYASLRRILKTPKRWDRIVQLAADAGERLPRDPDAAALSRFLERRHSADPAGFADLSLSVVKLLGSGEYGVDLPGTVGEGHFGLATRDYAHSTAPNRRFPDLIAQRLIEAALAGRPTPYDVTELTALAAHCTLQEDNATKVERQLRKSAAALLLATRIGARFEGIVTGASPKGTWVRIAHPAVEGKVVRDFEGLDVGDRAIVRLLRTDIAKGFIDFAKVREIE